MGGPLVGLLHNPSDPALLLVRQADNTLRVVNTATMKVRALRHKACSNHTVCLCV
jgi:hypothetical protein